MIARALFCFAAWLATLSCIPLAQLNSEQRRFEEYASRIRIFEAGEMVADRSLHAGGCGEPCAAAEQFRIEIKAKPPRPERLLDLLGHPDAKVRTLALAALIDQEDSRFLPQMHALVTDRAATFSGLVPTANSALVPRPQSVGELASLLTRFYTPETWKEDQERGYSALWFLFKLERATQSTSPIRPERIPRVREVRRQIELVPQPDRALILLSLHSGAWNHGDPLVTESELVAQLKSLGHEAMLRLLRKQAISSDRSLQSAPSGNATYHGMCLFVLRHARELLLGSDADALLAREKWERGQQELGMREAMISPEWAIAAASLRPAKAAGILNAALLRFGAKYQKMGYLLDSGDPNL